MWVRKVLECFKWNLVSDCGEDLESQNADLNTDKTNFMRSQMGILLVMELELSKLYSNKKSVFYPCPQTL